MRLDSAEVHEVAERIADAADLIDGAIRNHMALLAFDGVRAGRDYPARGDALRSALDRLTVELTQWSRAVGEIAAALRVGVDRYADADHNAAVRIA